MTEHDKTKAARLARKTFSTALMSDTKWRQLIEALQTSDVPRRNAEVKLIDVIETKIVSFPPSLGCPDGYMDTIEFGPVELCAIEWVKFGTDISKVIDSIGKKFPHELIENGSLITGYKR